MIHSQQEHQEHIETFYTLLNQLAEKLDGYHYLSQCNGRMNWPKQGVYFFFEDGEYRNTSKELRVVRVGTHGVSEGSKATLWKRLSAHRGTKAGSGNHRGSVFRRHIGNAIINKHDLSSQYPNWAKNRSTETRKAEITLEQKVSEIIGRMPFLWIEVNDEVNKYNKRTFIECNAIALLAGQYGKSPVYSPSKNWLGNDSSEDKIKQSGLWNIKHVGDQYKSPFLSDFKKYLNL